MFTKGTSKVRSWGTKKIIPEGRSETEEILIEKKYD
jgi:hypothetical protein